MVGWYGSQIAARVRPSSHLLVDQCDSITACTFNKKKNLGPQLEASDPHLAHEPPVCELFPFPDLNVFSDI